MNYRYILLPIILFTLLSCSNNDDNENNEVEEYQLPPKMQVSEEWGNLIIGEWEYIQQCEFGITTGGCNPPMFTHHYIFQEESVVLSDQFINNCEEGTYNLEQDILELNFSCVNLEVEWEIHFLNEENLILVGSGDDSFVYWVYKRNET